MEIPEELNGLSGLYNSPDPLLRRLRLQDTVGHDILDLEKYFKNKEILVLYAGSERGLNNIKAFHRNLTTFSIREMKTCSVIYISTDTDPAAPGRVLSGQAWLRMTYCDNSDFAPMIPVSEGEGKHSKAAAVVEEVSRGEDFIQAGEIETGMEKVKFGEDEYIRDYVRPLSRAAVTATMNAYSTPSIAIYHLPTHRFLSKNVRLQNFESDRIGKNYHTWRNGGTPSIRLMDIVTALKWPLFFLLLALAYRLSVSYGGQSYDWFPGVLDRLLGQGR